MTTLETLLERVKSATGPDRELDALIAHTLGQRFIEGDDEENIPLGLPMFTASIDSALALVERVLPGWEWLKKSPSVITLYRPLTEHEDAAKAWAKHFDGKGATIPLAILAACLSALIQGSSHE